MATRHDGFTLMEMMVVIAIIGILALIAAPSYLDQMIRKQIVDAVPLADIAKAPVAAAWAVAHALPRDNAAAPGQMSVKGENKTGVPTGYLPLNCRAPGS